LHLAVVVVVVVVVISLSLSPHSPDRPPPLPTFYFYVGSGCKSDFSKNTATGKCKFCRAELFERYFQPEKPEEVETAPSAAAVDATAVQPVGQSLGIPLLPNTHTRTFLSFSFTLSISTSFFLPSFLPSVRPSVLPSFCFHLPCFPSFYPSFLPSIGSSIQPHRDFFLPPFFRRW
jgi:hypothetical protein